MQRVHLASLGIITLIGAGCTERTGVLEPTPAATISAAAAVPTDVSGHFDAQVDFATLTLTPRGKTCLLQVKGQLVFSGSIQGTAVGQTTALVFAPCSEVATTPPGTYRDVFKSELVFDGTVNGKRAHANVRYIGGVEPGGHIDAHLVFSNGVAGVLDADAIVAVGGDYSGSLVVK